MTADALLTRVAVALHGVTPPDPEGALALHRDAAARVVAALGDESEGIAEGERRVRERVEKALGRLSRPLNGARQRANTNEDFAEIHALEQTRADCVTALRAALTTEPTP